jgi:hypothetical protein
VFAFTRNEQGTGASARAGAAAPIADFQIIVNRPGPTSGTSILQLVVIERVFLKLIITIVVIINPLPLSRAKLLGIIVIVVVLPILLVDGQQEQAVLNGLNELGSAIVCKDDRWEVQGRKRYRRSESDRAKGKLRVKGHLARWHQRPMVWQGMIVPYHSGCWSTIAD